MASAIGSAELQKIEGCLRFGGQVQRTTTRRMGVMLVASEENEQGVNFGFRSWDLRYRIAGLQEVPTSVTVSRYWGYHKEPCLASMVS